MKTEYGTGIVVKEMPDKIMVCAENTTRLIQGNFILEGKEIIVESGEGIKISSRHPNILVISVDTKKQDEAFFDLKKNTDERLKVIEQVFSKILKSIKQ